MCTVCSVVLPPAQLEQQAVEAAAEERHHAELQHAYKELLHMEDWSGASRDRFLGVRSNTAFEQRLKQASRKTNNRPKGGCKKESWTHTTPPPPSADPKFICFLQ